MGYKISRNESLDAYQDFLILHGTFDSNDSLLNYMSSRICIRTSRRSHCYNASYLRCSND